MDALSAPVIAAAPAPSGGEGDATTTQGSEVSAEFAALVAAMLMPLPGLPVPIPVEDATSAPAQEVGAIEAVPVAALPLPILPFALPPVTAPAVAEAAPVTVDEAPKEAAPAFIVALTPATGADPTMNVEAPSEPAPAPPSLEAAPTLAPEAAPAPEAPEQPAEPTAEAPAPVTVTTPRAERPAAVDVPAPILAAGPTVAPTEATTESAATAAPVVAAGPEEAAPTAPLASASVHTPAPVVAPQAPAVPAPAAPTAAAPHVQVVEAVGHLRHVDGTHEVTLELHPAELGPVKVTMTVEGSNVTLHLSAQNGATDDLLRRHLPDLQASLAEAGLNATSVDVGGSAPQRQPLGDGDGEATPTGAASAPTADRTPEHPATARTTSSSARLDVLL